MSVNRRTITLIVVVVAVSAGIYAITWWQRSRETQRLLKDLQDRDHAVATEAIEGLCARAPAIRDELLTLLAGGDDLTRWRAAELLGFAGGPGVRAALTAALDDSYPDVRLNAALSLGRLKAREAAGRIAMMAQAPDEELPVRIAAVNALRLLGAEDQLDALMALVEARPAPLPAEEKVAEEPAPAAATPTAPVAPPPAAAEPPVPPPDDTWLLRVAAVQTVGILAPAAQMRWMPEAPEVPAEDRTDTAPELEPAGPAARAMTVLTAAVDPEQEPNANVRQAACYALGDLLGLLAPDDKTSSATIQVLVGAMRDEASEVRIAAAHTLNIIPVSPADLPVVQDALAEALNDDHYWVRQAAMEATQGG